MQPSSLLPHAAAELAFQARIRPDERFSHLSAARIWGMPLPPDADPRLHTASPEAPGRRELPGVVGHCRGGETSWTFGLPLSSPLETFIELGTLLRLDDLVAVGDWLVLRPRRADPLGVRPFHTLDGLRQAVASRRSWGVRAARRAADLARDGAESRQETRLRLLLADAGIGGPECGGLLRDRHGRMIGWFDLVWRESRVAVEYDGDQHRSDTVQYEKDISRFDRAAAAGWRVIRVRAHGLSREGRAETIARVRAAFAAH